VFVGGGRGGLGCCSYRVCACVGVGVLFSVVVCVCVRLVDLFTQARVVDAVSALRSADSHQPEATNETYLC